MSKCTQALGLEPGLRNCSAVVSCFIVIVLGTDSVRAVYRCGGLLWRRLGSSLRKIFVHQLYNHLVRTLY